MYGKVFKQMYNGTLATKGPWEALVTFQQLVVLADKHGEVDMTAGAISRLTTVPLPIIEKGLKELMAPDPDSRTKTEGGRRIVLIDPDRNWGWRVVNYGFYAKVRNEEDRREAARAGMEKLRAEKSVNKLTVLTKLTHVDVDVDVDVKDQKHVRSAHGFELFWSTWPPTARKVAKAACLKKWKALAVDAVLATAIIDRVRVLKQSKQWQDGFEPAPLTFLNQRRWEDGVPQDPSDNSEPKQWD